MANLTIAVPDDVLKRARIKALDQGTSVNAVLREHLINYAGESEALEAISELISIAKDAKSGSGGKGFSWTRDQLHER